MSKPIELLAPVGNKDSLSAAIVSGADAVYLGVGRFNARGDKAQFSLEELPELVALATKASVKVYLTLNILFRDNELPEALALAESALKCGIAAVIVQDRGLMQLLRQTLPSLPVHASTQCTCGTKEAIDVYRSLGCRRIVLPRELYLTEIEELTAYAHSLGVETECFIHGALCMCVSGQCHMSHFMGGRNANRGDCAQSCRKQYKILRDGKPFRAAAAWLSPTDLGAYSILDQIVSTGVDSLKIEGRMRSAEYTKVSTSAYRDAIDAILDKQAINKERETDLLLAYNRGGTFHQQFWLDKRDKTFLSHERTGHLGVKLGEVTEIQANNGILRVLIASDQNLPLPDEGSQITLRTAEGEDLATAPCGTITRVKNTPFIELKGFHPRILRQLKLPVLVWQMTPNDSNSKPHKKPLHITLAKAGDCLFELTLAEANRRIVFSESQLHPQAESIDSAISADRCREQLSKLGDSVYYAASVAVEETPHWRISDLNRFRREALARLEALPLPKPEFLPILPDGQVKTDRGPYPKYSFVIALPFWRNGEKLPLALDVNDALLLLPAGELAALTEIEYRELSNLLTGETTIGALLPPENIPHVTENLKDRLKMLGILAFAQGPSGLPAWTKTFSPETHTQVSWLGNQLWNSKTATALSREGYTHALISPELAWEEQTALAKAVEATTDCQPLLWVYGRTQAMFTRFCPVGFSKGKDNCSLCTEARYQFVDDRERVFPLRPQRELACSFEVWQSEAVDYTDRKNLDTRATKVLVFTDENDSMLKSILQKLK